MGTNKHIHNADVPQVLLQCFFSVFAFSHIFWDIESVLGTLSRHNEMPETRKHKDRNLLFSQFWKMKVQDLDTSIIGECSLSDFRQSNSLYVRMAFPQSKHIKRETDRQTEGASSSYKPINPIGLGCYACDFI